MVFFCHGKIVLCVILMQRGHSRTPPPALALSVGLRRRLAGVRCCRFSIYSIECCWRKIKRCELYNSLPELCNTFQ